MTQGADDALELNRASLTGSFKKRVGEFYTEDEIERWWTLPHPQLDGRTAEDAMRGNEFQVVDAIISRLETGAYL